MSIKKIMTFLIFIACCYSVPAQAKLIFQRSSDALHRDIFEPRSESVEVSQPVVEDNTPTRRARYNYNASDALANSEEEPVVQQTKKSFNQALADKMFNRGTEGDMVLVDIDNYQTSVVAREGQFVAVRVFENDNTFWNFENRSRGLEFVKKEKRGNVLIMLYRATAMGISSLNFDLLAHQNGDVKALSTRILEVRVI